MKPILYSYWRSSCSYRVRIALNFKDIKYEYRPVNLINAEGEQKQTDFTQLNPKQEVPYFVHDGHSLAQSMAILQYIDDVWPKPELFPKDPKLKSLCLQLSEIINSGIQPIQNLNVMKTIGKRYAADDKEKASWSRYWIVEGFKALEQELIKTSGYFSIKNTVTTADLFLVPQCYNAKRFKIDLENEFPNIFRVYQNCFELEEFRRATPEVQPDSPQKK